MAIKRTYLIPCQATTIAHGGYGSTSVYWWRYHCNRRPLHDNLIIALFLELSYDLVQRVTDWLDQGIQGMLPPCLRETVRLIEASRLLQLPQKLEDDLRMLF